MNLFDLFQLQISEHIVRGDLQKFILAPISQSGASVTHLQLLIDLDSTVLAMIAAALPTLQSLRLTDYGDEVPNLLNPSNPDRAPQGISPLYETVSGDRLYPNNSLPS